jgi:hypothetical protein
MPDYYAEIDTELLSLAAEGGEYNHKEVVARIQDMKSSERQLLREALDRLDDWLDEATLDLHLNNRKEK